MNIDSIRSAFPRVVQAIDQTADTVWAQERDADYVALPDPAMAAARARGTVFCRTLNAARQAAGLKRDEPTPPKFLQLVSTATYLRTALLDSLMK